MADAELYGVSEYPMMGRGYKWTMTYRTRRVVSQRTIPERITACFTLNNATEFNRTWPAQYAGAGCRYFMKNSIEYCLNCGYPWYDCMCRPQWQAVAVDHTPAVTFKVPIKRAARRPRGGAWLVRTGPNFQETYPGQGILMYRLKSLERRAQ